MLVGIGDLQNASQRATLIAYQQSGKGALPMAPHGHPDANTSINQGKYRLLDNLPDSQVDYLTTGEEPGTFLRDLGGVSNQLPRWSWFVMGGTCLLLGGLAYRRHKQEKKSGKKKKD